MAKHLWITLMTAVLIFASGLLFFPGVSHGALISMNAQDEQLGQVLKKLSDSSGWTIKIDIKPDTTVSVDIKNQTLDEAIESILRNAGVVSHSVVKYPNKKEIVIHVFDESLLDSAVNDGKTPARTTSNDVAGSEMDQGITLREVLLSQREQTETNPLDEVVIPQDEEHPNGITLRELQEAEKNRPPVSLDDVVIPPDDEHPNGITLREINEAESARVSAGQDLNEIVVPPDDNHPNGMTLGEVKAAERARASAGQDLDEIVVPPDDNHPNGMTLREVKAAERARASAGLNLDEPVVPSVQDVSHQSDSAKF